MGTIIKKKLSSGKFTFIARVRRVGIGNVSKAFQTKAGAMKWVGEIEGKGVEINERGITFSEALEIYTKREDPDAKRALGLKRWKEIFGANMPLRSIETYRINEISEGWRFQWKPQTINHHIVFLSVFYKRLIEWGYVSHNPVLGARKYKLPRGIVRYLSDEERNSLLQACIVSAYKPLYTIVILALSTGMRKEEILSLRWQQVDLKARRIILTHTKNGEIRQVPIVPSVVEVIKKLPVEGDYLFQGKKESPKRKDVTPSNPDSRHFDIRKPWEAALKKAGINEFRFHDLRHSCASYLAMNGATPLEIAEVLGHKSLSMVKRYAHLSKSHVALVVQKMTKKFGIA